jgi:hypothetical protein
MSNDWGQDFDDEGNVLGEVPDGDAGFFSEHWVAVVVAVVAVFLLNVPRVGTEPGALVGAALASTVVGVPLAYVAVWVRGQF